MNDRMHPYVTGQPPERKWTEKAQRRVRWPDGTQARVVLYDAHGDALWGSAPVPIEGGDSVTFTVPDGPTLG